MAQRQGNVKATRSKGRVKGRARVRGCRRYRTLTPESQTSTDVPPLGREHDKCSVQKHSPQGVKRSPQYSQPATRSSAVLRNQRDSRGHDRRQRVHRCFEHPSIENHRISEEGCFWRKTPASHQQCHVHDGAHPGPKPTAAYTSQMTAVPVKIGGTRGYSGNGVDCEGSGHGIRDISQSRQPLA